MAAVKTIKTPIMFRSAELDRGMADKEKRTIELSFSSEQPVERWFGYEILDHKKSSVDLSRVNSGGPLLLEHDRSAQIGVIEKAWIAEDKKGRALVRFGNSARAQEIFQDVVDGIRRLVSVGYRVTKLVTEKVENEVETLRATAWQPMEISIVSVPADTSVGVGRAETTTNNIDTEIDDTMKILLDKEPAAGGGGASDPKDKLDLALNENTRSMITEAENNWKEVQAKNAREISSVVDKMKIRYPDIVAISARAYSGEIDMAKFRDEAFKLMHNATPVDFRNEQNIGMSRRDLSKYSWANAIRLAHNPQLDGFERELSKEAVSKYKIDQRAPHSIIVPFDVLNYSQRDQLVTTGSLGGNVVETQLLASSFIDVLRNRMMVARAGATMLTGLVGNVAIPRQSAAVSTFWASSEAASTTEGSLTFDQVTLTPRQITARVDYSWLLLNQSTPAVDGIIRNDFQATLARAIDLACLHGTGSSGQPTGVASTSGIGSVAGGTNGAAPTWGNIVSLESEVAIDNADIGALGYISNARVRGKLKQTLKGGTAATDGIYIWPDTAIGDGWGSLNGYKAGTTNQVSNTLTKGTSTTVCSAIFFGNWSDLLIAMWSGLEILTNPYTQASTRIVETYAYQACDVGVRHPESFAAMLDALTT